MKKLIFIRGHQGAGKTTFAKQLIEEYKNKYPNIKIHWAESDQVLEREQGGYFWSPKALSQALETLMKEFKNFLKETSGRDNDTLIIHSNTNQTVHKMRPFINLVKKQSYEIEVYVAGNFYPNVHNVSDFDVASAYINVRKNPYKGEIFLPVTTKPSKELKKLIDIFENGITPVYDVKTNSYLSKAYMFANKDKIYSTKSIKYPELKTFKYNNKVFWTNGFDKALIELRGLVMDENFNMVVRPFNKAFNLSERLAKDATFKFKIDPDTPIVAIKKINGYLGCATYVLDEKFKGTSFNSKVIYSTTGSLDSSYALLAENRLKKLQPMFESLPNHTFMFEIVDESDPHIIKEEIGVYLLAARNVITGNLMNYEELKKFASKFTYLLDDFFMLDVERTTWGDLEKRLPTIEHEGYVVYDKDLNDIQFKVKSPYYLITKFFARFKDGQTFLNKLNKSSLDLNFIQENKIEEEFFPLVSYLKENIDLIINSPEQTRVALIRDFLSQKRQMLQG